MNLLSTHERRIPHLFRCPISLDLFTDPVTLCTGQTYDRPCIERWISSGNLTCPITMLRLHDLSMVPNCTLSHLIRQWLDQTSKSQALLALGADHEHDDDYLAALKQTLESQEPPWEEKLQALKQVKALSLELPGRENESLIRFGFFPLLLELAFGRDSNGTHQRLELVELALSTALKLMPFSDLWCLNMLKEEGKMDSLSALLEDGTPLIKISLFYLLEAVLSPSPSPSPSPSCQQMKEMTTLIRNSGEIQRLIVNLILADHDSYEDADDYDEEDNAEVSEASVKAMKALCLNCANNNIQSQKKLEKLIQLGAVSSLARYILKGPGPGPGAGAAAVALEVLLEAEGGKEALLGEKNGVKALVKMVFRVCDHQGSESAVNSLMGLCCVSVEAREESLRAGVLTQLLLLLQSQCPLKAKTRARMLLKLLRNT